MKIRYILSTLGLSIGIFFLVTVFYAGESYFYYVVQGKSINFIEKIRYDIWGWMPWAFFVPVIIWLGRKFPIEKYKWYIILPFHIMSNLFFILLQALITYSYIEVICRGLSWNNKTLGTYIFGSFLLMVATYWVIIGICYLADYYKKNREHELKVSQMQTQLAQAQLTVLKSQLQPHFLFNTLHTINGLMFDDVYSANKMIAQLSDLLRFSLDKTNQQEIRFRDELEFIETYLNIQKTRFKDRLVVNMDIKPETLDATVPSMLLQPMVENALNHGIAPYKKTGIIRISAFTENENLVMEVHDNGNGLKSKSELEIFSGVGISNTIERLKQLYPQKHEFSLNDSPDGGLGVNIKIPYKLYPDKNQQE